MTKHGMRRMFFTVGAAALSLPIAGCGQLKPSDGVSKTQLQLTMDIRGATDVAGMRFIVQQVDCATGAPTSSAPQVVDKDLEDLTIPDQVPAVANMPLDAKSSHVFADAFLTLAPGCYDVTTKPMDAQGVCSQKCAPAHLSKVGVKAEQTTEVFLINQCEGTPTGAIDIASALNHPPQIQGVMFPASKFVSRCAPETVCATAQDPDSDPLEWSWSVVDGPAHAGPIVASTTTNPDGSVTQCIQVEGQEAGKLDVTLTVYDLVSPSGTPERVEQWLADQGYPGNSHAALTFPIYVADAGRTPSAEVCDGVDNDCNLQTDEGLTHDNDGDGYTSADSCGGSKNDCDDNNAAIHPGATETCNQVDDNCDGQVDEGGVCGGPDPECAGQTCGGFTQCNAGGSCSATGVCGSVAGGGGLCVDGSTSCAGLAACSKTSDCNAGELCFVDSCCGPGVCVPPSRFCTKASGPVAPAPLRTAAAATMSEDPGPTFGAKTK